MVIINLQTPSSI